MKNPDKNRIHWFRRSMDLLFHRKSDAEYARDKVRKQRQNGEARAKGETEVKKELERVSIAAKLGRWL